MIAVSRAFESAGNAIQSTENSFHGRDQDAGRDVLNEDRAHADGGRLLAHNEMSGFRDKLMQALDDWRRLDAAGWIRCASAAWSPRSAPSAFRVAGLSR